MELVKCAGQFPHAIHRGHSRKRVKIGLLLVIEAGQVTEASVGKDCGTSDQSSI